MKPRNKLSASQIADILFNDLQHQAFLNQKVIKFGQVTKLLQRMIDKYSNFYEARSASRERSQQKVRQ